MTTIKEIEEQLKSQNFVKTIDIWGVDVDIVELDDVLTFTEALIEQTIKEEREGVREVLEGVAPYLKASDVPTVCDLVYRTPAEGLRQAAVVIERRDTVIRAFDDLLQALNQDK